MAVSKSETESRDQGEECATAYLDSLLNAGLQDSESDTDSDSTEITSKEPQSALELKSESAALKLKVDALLGPLSGESITLKDEDRDSVKPESGDGTSKEPRAKDAFSKVESDALCEILSSDEDAPPGSWHKAPGWHPCDMAPGYPGSWLPRAFGYGPLGDTDGCKPDPPSYHVPRPFSPPRLPKSKPPGPIHVHRDVKKTVQEVVNAKDFHPEDFFFLANTLVENSLGRSLRNDDIEICDSPGQKELLVKELEIKLTIPIEPLAPNDTAKQLLSAMLALRLQMGTSGAVPTAKEPKSKKSKSKSKKSKPSKGAASSTENQEVNALRQEILMTLKRKPQPRQEIANQFGNRFASLRKAGHIDVKKFTAWLLSMPGVYFHQKKLHYRPPTSSHARTETGEGKAQEETKRGYLEQLRKVPRRF